MMCCPDNDVLGRVLAGTLGEPEGAAVRTHLAGCARCQERLDHLSDDPELSAWKAEGSAPAFEVTRDFQVGRVVAALCAAAPAGPDPGPGFLGPPRQEGDLGTLGPYSVRAEVGRGGMGIVLRAFDPELKRTVALKVLRPELATDRARARFVREAQAAARVSHDHLVRVYAVAHTPGGLPYLVMEYLEGPTLAQRVRACGKLEPAEAADLLAQAADGLAAAHAAGLVHRDVKPANVLLDAATGRAKVTDFGLARLGEGASGLTQEGVLAGTPAYMSPEQARGQEDLDARTDVYGLGATLYEALTGEVPFAGSPALVVHQVLHAEPVPPRKLRPGLPADLETICQKAMAREPGRRYQTARELADDLRRWRRGEPVRARPAGAVEQAWLWCRRNPRVAVLAATLGLVLLGGLAGVSWQWRRAEAQAAEARLRLAQAREAVDRYFTAVSEDADLKASGLEPLRRKLLGSARDYYEAFVREHAGDPELQAELGRAYGRLGVITAVLDSPPESLDFFEKERALFERLLRAHPDQADYRSELAETYWRLGFGLHYAGRGPDAWDALGQSRRLWEGLVETDPDNPEYTARLIRTLNSLGRSYQINGHGREAEEAYRTGQAVHARWAAAHALGDRHRESYAWLLANLGSLFRLTGLLEAATGPAGEAVALAEALAGAHPEETGYQDLLRHTLVELGEVYRRSGRASQAEATVRKARAVAERLARNHPASAEFQGGFALTSDLLGEVLYDEGDRMAEARALFHEALTIQEKRLEEHPGSLPNLWEWVGSFYKLMTLLRETGQVEAALELSSRSLGRWGPTYLDPCRGEQERACFAQVYKERALTLACQQKFGAAREDFEQALRLSNGPVRDKIRRRRELMEGAALLERGEHAAASARAQAVADQAGTPTPGDEENGVEAADLLYRAATLESGCAATAGKDGRSAEPYATRAVDFLRRVCDARGFRTPRERARLQTDPAFAPLRGRADFRELVAGLGARPPQP